MSHYGLDHSNFSYIEKTVNFASKLDQIDDVMKKEVIDVTLEAIQPRLVIGGLRSKSMPKSRKYVTKVSGDTNITNRLKHQDLSYDYEGRILTMNGS